LVGADRRKRPKKTIPFKTSGRPGRGGEGIKELNPRSSAQGADSEVVHFP